MICFIRRTVLVIASVGAVACAHVTKARQEAASPAQTSAIDIAISLFKAGQLSQARPILESEFSAHPEELAPVFYLGRIAFIKGRFSEAVELFERATLLAPDRAEIYDYLGRALGKVGAAANRIQGAVIAPKAKAAFEKAVELAPENLQARQDLLHYYLEIQSNVGIGADRIHKQAEAIARLDPVEGCVARGRICEYHKEFDRARGEYLAAVAGRPGDLEANRRLGSFCLATGDFMRGAEAFENILKLDAQDVDARFQLGRASALSGGNLDRGENLLREYLNHECSRLDEPAEDLHSAVWAHYWLGKIRERRGRRDLAEIEYQAALVINPDQAEIKKALKAVK